MPKTTSRSEAELIEAIRNGERDLFEELIQQHSATVFGIAWSRLGNHSLAEEAAQETFIKAYKMLGLLRHREKFGPWIATIARNVATNLGIRRRRELEKLDRWSLEQSSNVMDEPLPGETERTGETLRQAIAALPTIHRESLVLFYLEGKSIAESAALLGISETAFKTRLHRARETVRSALETRLESSLENLCPSSGFAGAVMLALPAQMPGTLFGGGVLAALVKAIPFAWVMFAVQVIAFIPGFWFARWLARKEQQNFRDPDGFRARNLERLQRSNSWLFAAIVFVLFMILGPLQLQFLYVIITAAVALPLLIWTGRRLYLVLNWTVFAEFLSAVLLLGFVVGLLFQWPSYYAPFAMGVMFLLNSLTAARMPMRMDYSLFLRAAESLLRFGSSPSQNSAEYSRIHLFGFGRYLAERFLVVDWRWRKEDLHLRLHPVTPRLSSAVPFIWSRPSVIKITPGGQVSAYLNPRDSRDLQQLSPRSADPAELQDKVERAVASALQAHVSGEPALAAMVLGEEPAEAIYRKPPSTHSPARIRVWMLRSVGVLMLAGGIFSHREFVDGAKRGVRIVHMSEPELRSQIESVLLSSQRTNVLLISRFRIVRLPDRRFFTDAALASLHELIRESFPRPGAGTASNAGVRFALHDPVFQLAFRGGLIRTSEFPAFNISVPDLRREVLSWNSREKEDYLSTRPISIGHYRHTVLNTAELHLRLNLLAGCDLLGEFDLTRMVPPLLQRQILPDGADHRWEDLDTKTLRGLFLMIHSSPILDTYDTLSVLKMAGALDRIDREECIRGILRLHQGYGLFKGPADRSEPWNIYNTGQNTWCALESLRLLNALDRANYHNWKFRAPRYHKNVVTWDVLAAVALSHSLNE